MKLFRLYHNYMTCCKWVMFCSVSKIVYDVSKEVKRCGNGISGNKAKFTQKNRHHYDRFTVISNFTNKVRKRTVTKTFKMKDNYIVTMSKRQTQKYVIFLTQVVRVGQGTLENFTLRCDKVLKILNLWHNTSWYIKRINR